MVIRILILSIAIMSLRCYNINREEINMTRFEQEISGKLGVYWKSCAEKEVLEAVHEAESGAVVDEDGAIRWKSNGHYIPDDFCEKLEYAGYEFSRQKTSDKRDEQVSEFISNYRKNKKELSEEEKIELDANNKVGTVIVDVISGRKYVTK